ncbi:hypothetical protein MPSEU_000018800 [Mayamaea pseudoterrestris]|nr:hypothetical protein MPSEU_000018800 [Mayamaea pseudoterrestris]
MSDRKRSRDDEDGIEGAIAASVDYLWNLQAPNVSRPNHFILSSRHTDALCLIGRGRIRCSESGESLTLNGYSLTKEFVYFDSPSWSSWATISGLTPSSIIEIKSLSPDAEEPSFSVHNSREAGSRPTTISTAWQSAMEGILQDLTVQQLAHSKQAQLPAFFQPTLEGNENAASFRVAVTGAKGVGKSTFLRLLMNQALSYCAQVALLDLDLGQPELTPPGMVSLTLISEPLLQPPSTRIYRKFQYQSAYYFGAVTSEEDPHRYMECVEKALNDYVQLLSTTSNTKYNGIIPLFINCDGYVKGLGEKLLETLLQKLEPTFVVKVVGSLRSQQFEVGALDESACIILTVDSILQRVPAVSVDAPEMAVNGSPSAPAANDAPGALLEVNEPTIGNHHTTRPFQTPAPLSISAALYRSQRLISYFMHDEGLWDEIGLSHDGIDDPTCEIGREFAARRPYKVPLDCLQLEFANPDLRRDFTSIESLLDIINGSVVGLCRRDHVAQESTEQGDGSSAIPEPLPASLLPCFGLGIVRSIDRTKRVLYVLTPIPLHCLNRVNVLVIGSIFLPLECYFRGVETDCFPYYSTRWRSDAIGADPMQSRNSIARRSLIRNG